MLFLPLSAPFVVSFFWGGFSFSLGSFSSSGSSSSLGPSFSWLEVVQKVQPHHHSSCKQKGDTVSVYNWKQEVVFTI